LWTSNPHIWFAERVSAANGLEREAGIDIPQLLTGFIDVAPHSPDELLEPLLAFGYYLEWAGQQKVFLDEFSRLKKPMQMRWNYKGVLAAARRSDTLLDPTKKTCIIRGDSKPIKELRAQVWSACFGGSLVVAAKFREMLRKENVLITGETGTGKEAIARIISEAAFSEDDDEPQKYGIVNASSFTAELLESELFGYTKGAFTGASEGKNGLIQEATGGVCFLDEVGDFAVGLQPKMLRVLESGKIRKVGDTKEIPVDVRFVGATHKDLKNEKTFRSDLFYRLNGFTIETPTLKDLREDDIAVIGESFVDQNYREAYSSFVADEIRDRYSGYDWPGNMRELRAVVTNLMLERRCEPANRHVTKNDSAEVPWEVVRGEWSLAQLEEWYVRRVLDMQDNNKTSAAKILGKCKEFIKRKYKI